MVSHRPVLRISRTLAAAMLRQLSIGKTTGHHEFIIGAMCQKIQNERNGTGCKKVNFDPDRSIHEIHLAGGTSIFKSSSSHVLDNHNVQPDKLYHPVKCKADQKSGDLAMSWSGLPKLTP